MQKEWITYSQAAKLSVELIGVPIGIFTITKWVKNKEFEVRKFGKYKMIEKESFKEFLNNGEELNI